MTEICGSEETLKNQQAETNENITYLPFTANISLRPRSTFMKKSSNILNHCGLISHCRNIFVHLLPYLATLVEYFNHI